MDVITDLGAALAGVGAACGVVDGVRGAEVWRLSGRELLDLAVEVERLARLVFAVQVAVAGELDGQRVAADHGCVSTAALLRQTLVISAADARHRVATARAVLPRDGISGGEVPAVLPLLAGAVAAGVIGVEQTRTVVASMRRLPVGTDEGTRVLCEKHLVDDGVLTEPKPFADFARAVVEVCTPDGEPDEDRSGKVELFLGVRNPATGMTRFHGQLDDLGVEVISQAIDALAKPCPATAGAGAGDGEAAGTDGRHGRGAAAGGGGAGDSGAGAAGSAPAGGSAVDGGCGGTGTSDAGLPASAGVIGDDPSDADVGSDDHCGDSTGGAGGADPGGDGTADAVHSAGDRVPDPRSAACRRGQALVEALRRFLDQGTAPVQGGQRPHITVMIGLEELCRGVGAGCLDFGGPVSAGVLRMLACDAAVIPAVLGTPSQVLDVGRANRLFPPGIRKAIALRDKGCAFPGCDRPPGWTEAHHIRHWINGGPSSLDNGVLLCSRHHREIHRGHWEVRMAADGLPEFLPPEWIDQQRKPRRNNSYHLRVLLEK